MVTNRPLCVIVGAGEGLGVSLARAFAQDGNDLILMGRSVEGVAKAREAAQEAGAHVEAVQADARDAGAIAAALGPRSGEAESLVYNPRGSLAFKPPLEVTAAELTDVLALEVVGALSAAQAVLPGMLARGRGTILFSSATAALRGSGRNLLYAAGKFGLRGVSQSLAKAYASKGIHVAHVRLDCALDVPVVKKMMGAQYNREKTADPDDVAKSYVWVHHQPRSAWSNEVELRPFTEDWTY